jgi:hypothetical protein
MTPPHCKRRPIRQKITGNLNHPPSCAEKGNRVGGPVIDRAARDQLDIEMVEVRSRRKNLEASAVQIAHARRAVTRRVREPFKNQARTDAVALSEHRGRARYQPD